MAQAAQDLGSIRSEDLSEALKHLMVVDMNTEAEVTPSEEDVERARAAYEQTVTEPPAQAEEAGRVTWADMARTPPTNPTSHKPTPKMTGRGFGRGRGLGDQGGKRGRA